jgi:hypothetical protein
MGAQAIEDSYHVHGQLYVRLRWRDCAGVARPGLACADWGQPESAGGPR